MGNLKLNAQTAVGVWNFSTTKKNENAAIVVGWFIIPNFKTLDKSGTANARRDKNG